MRGAFRKHRERLIAVAIVAHKPTGNGGDGQQRRS